MPAWIASALRLLGAGAAFGVGTELVGAGGGAGPLLGPVLQAGAGLPGDFIHVGGHPRRRRRRRALTNSDKADIAFIAASISKAAAKDFAMIIAARA